LFISVNYDLFDYVDPNFWSIFKVDQVSRSAFTIPYFDGKLSISRSARGYPNYLLFKPGMIITTIFLTQYWMAYNKLFKNIYSIISLSKILGLPGGGIALANGQQLEYKSNVEFEEYLDAFDKVDYTGLELPGIINNYKKSEIPAVSKNIKSWLQTNDLFGSISCELQQRQNNILILSEGSLTKEWPAWMKKAIEIGAGPGIAPLFRGEPDLVLMNNQKKLKKELGIETSIYHFNWSGDPLSPNYEKCLAIPVHGLIHNINKIVALLNI